MLYGYALPPPNENWKNLLSIWIVFGCLGRSRVESCDFEGGSCGFDGCFWSEVDGLVFGCGWGLGWLVACVLVFSGGIGRGGGGDICGGEGVCGGSCRCGHPICPSWDILGRSMGKGKGRWVRKGGEWDREAVEVVVEGGGEQYAYSWFLENLNIFTQLKVKTNQNSYMKQIKILVFDIMNYLIYCLRTINQLYESCTDFRVQYPIFFFLNWDIKLI